MICIGIVGTGTVSRTHVGALHQLPQAQPVAFVDPLVARAEAVAADAVVAAHLTPEELSELLEPARYTGQAAVFARAVATRTNREAQEAQREGREQL
ncbi:MAG: Gfo/Idh/MocA family oxidoreductase [Chloroflexi bacterium]|nr:Gfo/Idh/MocA family oxidoreductase [Chloroflexota bacterium]